MFSRVIKFSLPKLLLIVFIAHISSVTAKEPVVLVIGDSISAGFGMPLQEGWVALMESELQQNHAKISVINASISGDTTQGGLTRLPNLLTEHQPTLTIIELGGNDGLRGTPIRIIKNNLKQMTLLAQEANSKVLLLGMQIPPNYGHRYTEMFRTLYTELATELKVPLVPFLLDGVAEHEELMQADGIHPTAQAQPIMLKHVLPSVESVLADE